MAAVLGLDFTNPIGESEIITSVTDASGLIMADLIAALSHSLPLAGKDQGRSGGTESKGKQST
jgi:hypothetical protein